MYSMRWFFKALIPLFVSLVVIFGQYSDVFFDSNIEQEKSVDCLPPNELEQLLKRDSLQPKSCPHETYIWPIVGFGSFFPVSGVMLFIKAPLLHLFQKMTLF